MNTHLTQALQDTAAWSQANEQLIEQINAANARYYLYTHCQSRTLQAVVSRTINRYSGYSGIPNPYVILKGIYELILKKRISLIPGYLTPSAEQCATLETFTSLLPTPDTTTDTIKIYLYMIPKGKSFVRPILDANTLNRVKNVETPCLINISHFLRIYKGFNNTAPEDITIFTSDISEDFLAMLWILLPILLDMQPQTCAEDAPEELKEKIEIYNKRVKVLTKLCEELYSISEHTPQTLTTFIKQVTTELIKLFDFQKQALNSFTERLANATNENAVKHFKTELQNCNYKIKELEDKLQQNYTTKMDLERQLIVNTQLTAEDVKPFFETIQNSKHIEIMSSTDTTLRLRITAPLQYFSEDFERYEKNVSSDYNYYYKNLPEHKTILHKIFVTREYKIDMQAIVDLTINTNYNGQPMSFAALRGNHTKFTRLPNPHLWHHDCWSQAKSEMTKNICAGNYELVIMQAIAAVQTVNVAEHTSFVNGFLYDFRQNLYENLIYITDTDGNEHSLTEMLKIEKQLKQQLQKDFKEPQTIKKEYTQIEIPNEDDDEENND